MLDHYPVMADLPERSVEDIGYRELAAALIGQSIRDARRYKGHARDMAIEWLTGKQCQRLTCEELMEFMGFHPRLVDVVVDEVMNDSTKPVKKLDLPDHLKQPTHYTSIGLPVYNWHELARHAVNKAQAQTIKHRIQKSKMSLEEALTIPINDLSIRGINRGRATKPRPRPPELPPKADPNSLSSIAFKLGIARSTLCARMKKYGLTLDEARDYYLRKKVS